MDWSLQGASVRGISQARILELGCCFLLLGIFLTQGSYPGLWHCRQTLYHLNHQGSPIKFCLRHHGLCSPWSSPSQNTGVCSLSLLQEIFPTQGLNPGLPHCRWILDQLSHNWSPRILERVAYPFSSGSSWPRNWSGVSCIAGRFFTNWATGEDHNGNGCK